MKTKLKRVDNAEQFQAYRLFPNMFIYLERKHVHVLNLVLEVEDGMEVEYKAQLRVMIRKN